jgi:hypothetical protein
MQNEQEQNIWTDFDVLFLVSCAVVCFSQSHRERNISLGIWLQLARGKFGPSCGPTTNLLHQSSSPIATEFTTTHPLHSSSQSSLHSQSRISIARTSYKSIHTVPSSAGCRAFIMGESRYAQDPHIQLRIHGTEPVAVWRLTSMILVDRSF